VKISFVDSQPLAQKPTSDLRYPTSDPSVGPVLPRRPNIVFFFHPRQTAGTISTEFTELTEWYFET
jgi:hypothetical protein